MLVPAQDQYLRIGDFAMITITDASEFDLVGEVAKNTMVGRSVV